MLQTIRFYNSNVEKEVRLSEDDIKRVPFIEGMRSFYGKLPETVSINMENFVIDDLEDLFTNKTVEIILRNVEILDYLCVSLKEMVADVSTDVSDLMPFLSYIKGENRYLELLTNCTDSEGELFAINHIQELYDLLKDINPYTEKLFINLNFF